MKNKERKILQNNLALSNIDFFINLLKSRQHKQFDKQYIREIEKLSQGFNIRLKREEKLLYCKKCKTYLNTKTQEIRFNNTHKTKDIICKTCGHTRKFKYK